MYSSIPVTILFATTWLTFFLPTWLKEWNSRLVNSMIGYISPLQGLINLMCSICLDTWLRVATAYGVWIFPDFQVSPIIAPILIIFTPTIVSSGENRINTKCQCRNWSYLRLFEKWQHTHIQMHAKWAADTELTSIIFPFLLFSVLNFIDE